MADAYHQDDPTLPVGERLRHARAAKGLTLDDVAARTRIPIRHLRSIEDGSWSDLPAITYTIGFGRNYANAVGLDGAEIGRQLRDQLGGEPRTSQMSTEYYAPPDPSRVPSRSVAWIAGILAVVLVAGYLLWRSSLGDEEGAAAVPANIESAPQPQAPSPAPAQPDFAGQPVTLTATDAVWFSVTDASGASLRSGELAAGQSYQVPATAQQPAIRTSRPQALRVRIGDRDFGPLAPEERLISGQTLVAADLARQLGGQAQPAGVAPGAAPGPARPPQPNGFQPIY